MHLTVLHILHQCPLYDEEQQIVFHLFGTLGDILEDDSGYISNVKAFLRGTVVDLSLTDFVLPLICGFVLNLCFKNCTGPRTVCSITTF
jgi:hypothetical protein